MLMLGAAIGSRAISRDLLTLGLPAFRGFFPFGGDALRAARALAPFAGDGLGAGCFFLLCDFLAQPEFRRNPLTRGSAPRRERHIYRS